jgi:integrase
MRDWQGSLLTRRGRLLLQLRLPAGWVQRATGLTDTPQNRVTAHEALAMAVAQLKAGGAVDPSGRVTVRAWAARWLSERKTADVRNERTRLQLHVLPVIGDLALVEVRPRHIIALVERLKRIERAPRTVHNVYAIVKAMFRDAALNDLIAPAAQPCILTTRQLGKIRDKQPGWRPTARYSAEELSQLISDDRIPLVRRTMWGILGLAGLRVGEMAGLRWRAYDPSLKPLGRLHVMTSYDNQKTKTGTEREVPVHPVLRALLADWRRAWHDLYGRIPGPDDLVVPTPPEPRRKGRIRAVGSMLDDGWVWKRLKKDRELLGIEHKRVHDLRRTTISAYQDAGASVDKVQWFTHAAPRDVMGQYSTLLWRTLCAEVQKLKLPVRADRQLRARSATPRI